MVTPVVTAVVVTYRSEPLIEAALSPLKAAHDEGWLECIVVDNASADGTAELVERRHPWARLFKNRRNHGFGRACNTGIRQASTPYVLLLNPDASIASADLKALVEFMDKNPRVGVVSPAVILPDGTLQAAWEFPSPGRVIAKAAGFHRKAASGRPVEPGTDAFETDWLAGAVMLLRADMLRTIGLFDPRFFLYFEETDLCQRTRDAGWQVWAFGRAVAQHQHGASARAAGGERIDDCLSEFFYPSRFYYLGKHYGWAKALVAEAVEPPLLLTREVGRRLIGRKGRGTARSRFRAPWFKTPRKARVAPRSDGTGAEALCREMLVLCAASTSESRLESARASVRAADAEERIDALGLLRNHEVFPAIWCAAVRNKLQDLPGFEPARARHELSRMQNELRMQQLAMLLTRLKTMGIEPIFLKGMALLNSIYGDPGERSMEDIDFLIRPDELQRVEATLAEMGFVKRSATSDAVQYKAPGGLLLDVHHRMRAFESLDLPRMTRRMKPKFLPVDEMIVFEPDLQLAHLCLHLAGHRKETGCLLVWLLDIGHVMHARSAELDWKHVRRLMGDGDAVAMLLRAAGFFQDELGQILPPKLAEAVRGVPPFTLSEILRGRRRATVRPARAVLNFTRGIVSGFGATELPSVGDVLSSVGDARRHRLAHRRSSDVFPTNPETAI